MYICSLMGQTLYSVWRTRLVHMYALVSDLHERSFWYVKERPVTHHNTQVEHLIR